MPNGPKARLIAAIAFLFGVGNVYAGVVGFSPQPTGLAVLAVLAALGGIACLVFAVGTCRRLLYAWRLGFGLIVWNGAYFVLGVILSPPASDAFGSTTAPIWLVVVGSLVVGATMARVWNQQRELFGAG
jgi:hypothetical protein